MDRLDQSGHREFQHALENLHAQIAGNLKAFNEAVPTPLGFGGVGSGLSRSA